MNSIEFLVVCYKLGVNYHSGQWSKGYRLLCLAQMRADQEHTGMNLGRTLEQLDKHTLYPKGGSFRNEISIILMKMRHYRFSL